MTFQKRWGCFFVFWGLRPNSPSSNLLLIWYRKIFLDFGIGFLRSSLNKAKTGPSRYIPAPVAGVPGGLVRRPYIDVYNLQFRTTFNSIFTVFELSTLKGQTFLRDPHFYDIQHVRALMCLVYAAGATGFTVEQVGRTDIFYCGDVQKSWYPQTCQQSS